MGGLILLGTLIAVYIIIYWSITIEMYKNKTIGFLGFIKTSQKTLHAVVLQQKKFIVQSVRRTVNKKNTIQQSPAVKEANFERNINQPHKSKKPFLKK